MTNRIWIVLTIIVVVAGYGCQHQAERTALKYSGFCSDENADQASNPTLPVQLRIDVLGDDY